MSSRQLEMCVGSVVGHNMTPEQRRAAFQAEITRHVIEAKKIEAMSLEEIKILSDKQRLTAYQNGHLIATIRACRMTPRLDAYFAVLAIVYAMADLSQRCCMLSANQIGQVLDRSERAVRAILSRLVDDGKIIKGEPLGRYGVVPHYPAIDRNTALATGSADWIINAFVPGIFAKDRAGKTKYEQGVEDHPCTIVHGSNTDPCTVRHGSTIDPCSTVHGVDADPCTVAQAPMKCSAATPDVQFIQNSSKEIALSKKIPPYPPMGAKEGKAKARKVAFEDLPQGYWGPGDGQYGVDRGMTPDQVRAQFANFRDHHVAKGSKFANWRAAWQLWCRRASEYSASAPQSRSRNHGGEASVDDQRRALRAIVSGLETP